MKKSAKTRIILWSVVAVLLIGALAAGIYFDPVRGYILSASKGYDGEVYAVGSGDVYEDIDSIEINWVDGKVTVEPYDGDVIKYYEEASGSISESRQMRSYVEGDKLRLDEYESESVFDSLFRFNFYNEEKYLTVKLPRELSLNTLDIDIVSGETVCEGVSASDMRLTTVSGGADISGNFEEISCDATSGNINVETDSAVNRFTGNSVSGKITLEFAEYCPDNVSVNTVSGSVSLELPKESAFIASMDSVSGKLNTDFTFLLNGDNYVVGNNPKAKFSFDTVSGDVEIFADEK